LPRNDGADEVLQVFTEGTKVAIWVFSTEMLDEIHQLEEIYYYFRRLLRLPLQRYFDVQNFSAALAQLALTAATPERIALPQVALMPARAARLIRLIIPEAAISTLENRKYL